MYAKLGPLGKGHAHGRAKQFGDRIMVSGLTSGAVGRLKKKKNKKKKKMMTKSWFC